MRKEWRNIVFIFCLYFIQTASAGQNIAIRLFAGSNITALKIFHVSGDYEVYGGNIKLFDADNISVITLLLEGDSILFEKTDYRQKFTSIRFIPTSSGSSLKILPLHSGFAARTYDDALEISVMPKTLKLINLVDIEKYVGGVVLAEVGPNNPLEFNKVKTIVCRTYALGNWRRHEDEGFQLCDEVHCQVFKGKTFNPNITRAVSETAEYILVDDSARIIIAAFYSNCGGQTANSEDVWSKPVSCLRSVNDSFCLHKPHAIWEKRIPKDLWLDYIKTRYGYPVEDSVWVKKVLNFSQPNRKVYLVNDKYFIPLKFVREDMKLKSTFFNIKDEGKNILFSGRGYGHGVGLCQEGAMRMAEKGISYIKIINYYYSTVHLIRFSQLDFFKAN